MDEERKVLVFYLGDERYAMDVSHVIEVIQKPEITPLPLVPDFILGVINLRGQIVPVVDMRKRFNLPVKEGNSERVIIAEANDGEIIGFLVDAVTEVISIDDENVSSIPEFLSAAIDNEYLSGILKDGDRITILISTDRILNPEDILTMKKAMEESSAEEVKSEG